MMIKRLVGLAFAAILTANSYASADILRITPAVFMQVVEQKVDDLVEIGFTQEEAVAAIIEELEQTAVTPMNPEEKKRYMLIGGVVLAVAGAGLIYWKHEALREWWIGTAAIEAEKAAAAAAEKAAEEERARRLNEDRVQREEERVRRREEERVQREHDRNELEAEENARRLNEDRVQREEERVQRERHRIEVEAEARRHEEEANLEVEAARKAAEESAEELKREKKARYEEQAVKRRAAAEKEDARIKELLRNALAQADKRRKGIAEASTLESIDPLPNAGDSVIIDDAIVNANTDTHGATEPGRTFSRVRKQTEFYRPSLPKKR